MARPKGSINKIDILNNEPTTIVDSLYKKVVILSKNNIKFGIYWIDGQKEREFIVEEFEKIKATCKNFEEEFKKGNIKIEYR